MSGHRSSDETGRPDDIPTIQPIGGSPPQGPVAGGVVGPGDRRRGRRGRGGDGVGVRLHRRRSRTGPVRSDRQRVGCCPGVAGRHRSGSRRNPPIVSGIEPVRVRLQDPRATPASGRGALGNSGRGTRWNGPGLRSHGLDASSAASCRERVAIVPVIFSVAEDALSAVPRDWVRAALALGATPWEAVSRVVLPAAAPGVGAAVLLGLAQALGETMIVMMVSGNAATLSWSLWEPVRTVPVTLALELGETARGGPHYRVLFLLGSLLLALSVVLQGLVRWIRRRYVGRGAEWRS
ncbi:MAG: ABC transporter permease subunit [Proteobacteria bacterium]|nr:ABC transporter permease subunit [Pseudomonadota bacterium]